MQKNKLNELGQPIVDIYTNMENELLTNVAGQLKGTTTLLETDPAAWKLQQLQNLGMLDKDNLKTIRKHAGLTSAQLNGILYGAGLEGLDELEKSLEQATKKGAHLITPLPVGTSLRIYEILRSYERQATNTLNLTNTTMLNSTKQIYRDVINQTTAQVMSGTMTGEQAIRTTIKKWGENGVPALVDSAGRQWGPEGYARMVITSTMNNTVNDMQEERFNQWNVDLIEISSHAGNRPGCRPYAGRIFSLRPNHPKYPYLYDPSVGRIGAADSLFGINCGHIQYPFFEGISTSRYSPNPKEEDERIYKESQQQRAYERSIRKAKTQKNMLEAAGDTKGAAAMNKLIKGRQARMRTFIDNTGRTRRYARESVVGTRGLQQQAATLRTTRPPMPKPKPMTTASIPDTLHQGSILEVMRDGALQTVQLQARRGNNFDVELKDGTAATIDIINIKNVMMEADPPRITRQAATPIITTPTSERLPIKDVPATTDIDENRYKFITDPTEADSLIEEGKSIFNSLNEDQDYAVGRYVGTPNSWKLNETLYTGQYDKLKKGTLEMTDRLEERLEIIDELSNIIKANKLPQDIRALRMVDDNFLNSVLDTVGAKTTKFEMFDDNTLFMEQINAALAGVKYKNKSFTSVSYNPDQNMFKDKPIKMEILADKGKTALITNNTAESEIIFDKDTEFKFIRFEESIERTVEGDEIRFLKTVVKVMD